MLVILSPILIVLGTILIVLSMYEWIRSKVEKRQFEAYLLSIEGHSYFSYTHRQISEAYVKENILPSLPAATEIIYLSDKMWNLGNDIKFLNRLVGSMKMTKGSFPYVSKVKDGKLITMSVNDRLYSAIKRNIDANAINEKIHRFLR